MCEELYGHIWWRRGWGEIIAVRKQIPYFCKASLLSALMCVLFPCSLFAFESPSDVPGEVCQRMGWQKLVHGHGYLWSTMVWQSQLPLAVEVGLAPFCHCCCFSFPLYAITFRKQDQNALGKPNGFWETAALHPKLCNANFPVNFQECWHWASHPSLIDTIQASSSGTAACSLLHVFAKSQSTAPTLTCGWNDSSSFHTLVHCSRWGVSPVSLFLFHY